MKVLLLGGTGYIGGSFEEELENRGIDYINISRGAIDYTDYRTLCFYFEKTYHQYDLCINAAAYIPHQSVSLCDEHPKETIKGNVLLPTNLARVLEQECIPLAHISTGCLWSDGIEHTEEEPPQRAFKGYCGFYVGTKILAEEEVRKYPEHYIWRVRLPFDEFNNDRNYLTKISKFAQVWEQNNSCSHRRDFVKACLDMWLAKVPYGTYHVTNPGFLNSVDVLYEMQRRGLVYDHEPEILRGNTQGECRLSVKKLLSTGVKIRPVEEAFEESLKNWT